MNRYMKIAIQYEPVFRRNNRLCPKKFPKTRMQHNNTKGIQNAAALKLGIKQHKKPKSLKPM
jgi:hypothetical protein